MHYTAHSKADTCLTLWLLHVFLVLADILRDYNMQLSAAEETALKVCMQFCFFVLIRYSSSLCIVNTVSSGTVFIFCRNELSIQTRKKGDGPCDPYS